MPFAEAASPSGNSAGASHAAGVDREFAATILFCGFLLVYLFYFLLTTTEAGVRLGIYLSLMQNASIYWAYWTGSANGSIHLLDRWPIVAGVTFHLLIALGMGRFIFRLISQWLTPPDQIPSANRYTTLEKTLLQLGVGLSLLSTGTLLAGMFQLYHWKIACLLPAVGLAVAGWISPGTSLAAPGDEVPSETRSQDPVNWQKWLWLAGIPFGLFILLGSMISPWEFDVREYHLQVPKEWFQGGGVQFLPNNVYGNMPLGTEMHALFAMLFSFGPSDWWWGAHIGKTISGLFSILSSGLLFAIGCRWKDAYFGGAAAVIYLCTPWVTANSIVGYNEGAMGFYLLAGLLVISCLNLRSEPLGHHVKETTGHWKGASVLLGIFVGSAIACKYTAVLFVALPIALLIAGLLRTRAIPLQPGIRISGFFLLGILLIAGPWLLKNLIWIGNPVYPLLESVFQSHQSPLQIQQWNLAHAANRQAWTAGHLQSSLLSLLVTYKWLNPLVFPLMVMALVIARKEKWLMIMIGWVGFSFVAWWLLTHRLERFLLPVFPLACLVAAFGLTWTRHPAWIVVATSVLLMGVGSNLWISTSRLVGDVRVLANLEHLDLRYQRSRDYEHPDIVPLSAATQYVAWINENQPAAKVLLLGECRPFTAQFKVIYNTCFDTCETFCRLNGKTPAQAQADLKAEGITHLLVNWSELERLSNTYGYQVSDTAGSPDYPQLIRTSLPFLQKLELTELDQKSTDRCELFAVRGPDVTGD